MNRLIRILLTGSLLAFVFAGTVGAADQLPRGALIGKDVLNEDYTIADLIGEDVYTGRCSDDLQRTEMAYATERVSEAFGIQVKACNCADHPWMGNECNYDFNAFADSHYKGVIWYTNRLVDDIKRDYAAHYRHVLEFVAAHEIGHLTNFELFDLLGIVVPPAQRTISDPPIIQELLPVVLPPVTNCGFLIFDSIGCANWYRITWEQMLNDQFNVFLYWWELFWAEQDIVDPSRRLEQFSDCIAGSYFAESAVGLGDKVVNDVMDNVIRVGAEMPHGTHPTDIDRVTATYHGVAGMHFGTSSIVNWCSDFFLIDTRSDDLLE